MAHVVGVPKRDPCRKCQLPVFLAERLMVGKKVYHRTCLKCARCGYQLTPGSFYETEVDDQYCCETCPDEEVTNEMPMPNEGDLTASSIEHTDVELRNNQDKSTNIFPIPTRSVRNSIKERLTFFERQTNDEETDTTLLQKSLSDEEKSKSLQRIESSNTSYVSNKLRTSFLNNTVNDVEDDVSEEQSSSKQNSQMDISESDGEDRDDLNDLSMPPELPKSLPPLNEHSAEKTPEETHKRFTASTQLVLLESTPEPTPIKDEQQNIVPEIVNEKQISALQINLSTNKGVDNTNNNNNSIINEEQLTVESLKTENETEEANEETIQVHQNEVDNNLELNRTNDNDCVTKDNSADELTIQNIGKLSAKPLDSIDADSNTMQLLLNEPSLDIEPVNNDEEVELRTKSIEKADRNNSLSPEDAETTQRLSVVRARLQQFEVITNNEESEKVHSISHENYVDNEISNENNTRNTQAINIASETPITLCETSSNQVNNVETNFESPNPTVNEIKVPLTITKKDNEDLESKLEDNIEHLDDDNSYEKKNNIKTQLKPIMKTTIEEYPEDLNPFKSDDETESEVLNDSNKENVQLKTSTTSMKKDNLNPFDSSDDEVELEKSQSYRNSTGLTSKIPPPRPPPPRISKNPFGSEDEDEITTQNFQRRSSLTGSQSRKTPVPTPRSNISQSQNPTPEPTPRLSSKPQTPNNNSSLSILQNSSEYYGSVNSLHSTNTTPLNNLLRNSEIRCSSNSLSSSAGGTIRSRKSRRAPLPPAPVKELFPSNETINSSSKTSTPSSSIVGTPKSARKKRPAPAPPKPARLEGAQTIIQRQDETIVMPPKNLNSYPLQSELDSKLSDEEKALLEGKTLQSLIHSNETDVKLSPSSRRSTKRLIPLDKELLEEHGVLQYGVEGIGQCDDLKQQNQQKISASEQNEPSVVYRRVLIPQNLETPTREQNPLVDNLSASPSFGERQLEKIKDNKEANNRNRQSQVSVASSGADDNDPLFNKSAHGKWKRRKGPAPALPIPPRKVLQMLPLQEIKHELEIIEVQQQGLEKQGVILEKMIRDRCEGENGEPLKISGTQGEDENATLGTSGENSKEVENLILQLFELVNEKNELFRRQAELMYLRRQHRLEQEQADLEYEIRILMAQPERNKTDSDKAREEALIERLVEVVKLRNEVVECLEMDRIREAEEDQSIKQRLESHIAKRDFESSNKKTLSKLSKKEKKKQKEAKKLIKSKKLDADKDADESELLNLEKQKSKKKKKLLIF